jgi:hypothetical protein
VATASTHSLAFVGTDLAGGDNTVFIDNVVINPGTLALPASLGAMLPSPGALVMSIGNLMVGHNYEVQSATNLVAPTWVGEANFVASQTMQTITNSTAGAPQKFYRLVGH